MKSPFSKDDLIQLAYIEVVTRFSWDIYPKCAANPNYLYITRSVLKASPAERKEILKLIPDISPVAWEHFNFQGEFDFDESLPRDTLEQDLQAMFDFQIDEDDLI